MDILRSALESGADSNRQHDEPGFVALVTRVTRQIVALGVTAESAEVDAASLALIQDVAQFTLSWAEQDGDASSSSANSYGVTLKPEENIRAERRW